MDRESYLSSDRANRSLLRNSLGSSKNQADSRLYNGGETRKTTRTEYTTFYSHQTNSKPSHLESSSVFNGHLSAQPGSTVIEAFRDLQRKVKSMEEERYQACQIRDDLKARIALERRNQQVERNRKEYDTAEALLEVRTRCEGVRRLRDEIQSKVNTQQEVQDSIQRKIAAQKSLISSLQEDVERNRNRFLALEEKNLLLEKDLRDVEFRNEELTIIRQSSPEKSASKQRTVEVSISDLEHKVTRARRSTSRLELHVSSLQAYIDLLVRINGDLIDTLQARESVKKEFLKVARSLSPPPRYAWPKDVHYTNVVDIISSAAQAQVQAVAEQSALQATEAAMKSLVNNLSPSKNRRTAERDHSPARLAASLLRHSGASSSGRPAMRHVATSPSFSGARSAMSFHELQSDGLEGQPSTPRVASAKKAVARNEEEEEEAKEEESDEVEEEEDGEEGREGEDGSEGGAKRTTKTRSTRTKHRTRRSEAKERKMRKKTTTAGGARGEGTTKHRQRAASAERSRMARRHDVLTKVLARQGAITSATRLAAAANAVSTTVRVHNNPPHASNRPRTSTTPPPTSRLVNFIPASSANTSPEFNIIASVSKASRAASQLNATIASKVKSLHAGGAGRIYEEVPRVTLLDLRQKLAAAKKLRQSFQ